MKRKTIWESSLREILAELDIYTLEDYQRLVSLWVEPKMRLDGGGQEKIDALRQAVTEYYYNFTRNRLLSGQYISVNPTKLSNNFRIDNYMCIFPKRALIETSSMCSFVDLGHTGIGNYDMPPDDFYKQYFRYQNLVDKDIVHLYPVSKGQEENDGKSAVVDSSSIIRLKNVADVSHEGQFERIVERANIFYLAFPWLYGADTETYVDICDQYPAEYENFANTIEKLATASNDGTDFQEVVLKDLKDSLINIQIAFDKKRMALKNKGITATLGVAMTCIQYAIPFFFHSFDPALLSTIIGGASLLNGKDLLNNFWDLKHSSIENPYWVLWEWERRTCPPQ